MPRSCEARNERISCIDMPFMSYEASNEEAVRNAGRLICCGAQSVKLEGGAERAERIAAIVNAGIPVMAHIGVVPQTAALDRGLPADDKDRDRLLADADAVAAAGAFAVVLEMVDHDVAREITRRISIPTIGIGSGRRLRRPDSCALRSARLVVVHSAVCKTVREPVRRRDRSDASLRR